MTPVDIKNIARRAFEQVWNEGHFEVIPELHTPNCVTEDPNFPIEGTGIEALKKYAKAIRLAFPDIEFKVVEQIAEGDTVVNFVKITGTQEHEFLGIPATHRKATVSCFTLQRFENGKIARIYNLWDALGFLKNAGVMEKLQEPALHR